MERIKLPTLEDEVKIFKNRFDEFGMLIEFEKMKENYCFNGPRINLYADILFYCNNIQQYLEKSVEIGEIIDNEFIDQRSLPPKSLDNLELWNFWFKGARRNKIYAECSDGSLRRYYDWHGTKIRYVLDHLTIDGIKDNDDDRKDLILSDYSGKLLSYTESNRGSLNNKSWSTLMFSEKGDKVRVKVDYLEKTENERDVDICQLKQIKNYSLEKRLKK